MPPARRPSGRPRPPLPDPRSGTGPGTGHPPPTDGDGTDVLLLTEDADLLAAVSRLAAAAGCGLRQAPGAGAQTDGLVLVGPDADPARVARARDGGADVVLVGCAPVAPDWWQAAAALDVDHAAVLPEAEPWLLDRLADAADGPPRRGRVVGVLGGSGGAGASLVAAALATAACDAGEDVLLLDADPHSGGADLLLGADQLPGLRWGDLAGLTGRVRPDVLRACVDAGTDRGSGGSLHVLAGDRTGAGPALVEAVPAVLDAARRTFGITVLDLPRGALGDLPDEVLSGCEEVLVVLPGTTRAAAAACSVVDGVRRRPLPPPVRVVVRDVGTSAVPAELADVVGAPLAGVLRSERELDAGLERGEGLPVGRRSGLRGLAARWVADTGPARWTA